MTSSATDEVYMLERHLLLELSELKKKIKNLKNMKLGDSANICIEKKRFTDLIVQVQEIYLAMPIYRRILNSLTSLRDRLFLKEKKKSESPS